MSTCQPVALTSSYFSFQILSQQKQFISILINNIVFPEAVALLAVVSRLDPPVMDLVEEENLDVIIRNKNCIGVLKKISL